MSFIQAWATWSTPDGEDRDLTDDQVDAVVAADAYPSPPDNYDVTIDDVHDIDRHHVDQILEVMDAGFTLDEIHKLFHNVDGQPIGMDDEVDAAIAKHDANSSDVA